MARGEAAGARLMEVSDRLVGIRAGIRRPNVESKIRVLREKVRRIASGRCTAEQADRLIEILCLPVDLDFRQRMELESFDAASLAKKSLALAELMACTPELGALQFWRPGLGPAALGGADAKKRMSRLRLMPEVRRRKKDRIFRMLKIPASVETLVHDIERDYMVLDECRKLEEKIDHCLSKIKENLARL